MARQKRSADEEIDRLKKVGRFLNKALGTGNGTGSRVVKDEPKKPVQTREKPAKPDINLSDEMKGKIVGWTKKMRPMNENDFGDDEKPLTPYQRERMKTTKVADPILGGDKDDPRWDEHNRRTEESKRRRFWGVGAGSRIVRDK